MIGKLNVHALNKIFLERDKQGYMWSWIPELYNWENINRFK